MPLSIENLGEVDLIVGQWCLAKVPPQLKAQIDYDYEVEGQAVTLFEVRPAWQGSPGEKTRHALARLRHIKLRQSWQINWRRASGKWQRYEPGEARSLQGAMNIIERDAHGCFFG